MSSKKIGGPSSGLEKCKSCGATFKNYRGGSYDYEPENCFSCKKAEIEADAHRSVNKEYVDFNPEEFKGKVLAYSNYLEHHF